MSFRTILRSSIEFRRKLRSPASHFHLRVYLLPQPYTLYRSTHCSTVPYPFCLIHIPLDAEDSSLSVDTSLIAIRPPVEGDFVVLSHTYPVVSLGYSYLSYLISSSFLIGFFPLHPHSTRPLSLYPIVLPAFLYHCSFYHNNVRIDLTT